MIKDLLKIFKNGEVQATILGLGFMIVVLIIINL